MPLLLVLVAVTSYDARAGQSLFDLIKQVGDINKGVNSLNDVNEDLTEAESFSHILGGIACGSAVKNATALVQAGAFMACSKVFEALSEQLTEPELAEVQASTEEALTTGEDRTWTNDAGVKVETKIVKSETRTATVPLAMGFVQADVSAKKSIIIYTSPSKDSDLLAFLEPDEEIFVVGRLQSVDWFAVESENNVTGFVEAESIQDEVPKQAVVSKYIARGLTVIYNMPSKESKLLAAIEEGEQVLVIGQTDSDKWYKVQAAGKKPAGYIQAASLKPSVTQSRADKPKNTVPAQTTALSFASGKPDAHAAVSEQQAAPQHPETDTKDVTVHMRCKDTKQTVTLDGGEIVVEESTWCKTPINGWRQV